MIFYYFPIINKKLFKFSCEIMQHTYDVKYRYIEIGILGICLGSTYFAVGPMNGTKKCNETHK